MRDDIFEQLKARITAPEVAELYGYKLNRGGFICCPFHAESTPSMKAYPGSGGFFCFGCSWSGDVISFVGRLYGLDAAGAAAKLNDDFHLGLALHRKPTRQEKQAAQHRREVAHAKAAFEQWRSDFINQLNWAFREGHLVMKDRPEKLTEQQQIAVAWHDHLEAWSDILMFGTLDEQMRIFKRKGQIGAICQKILNDTPQKSSGS